MSSESADGSSESQSVSDGCSFSCAAVTLQRWHERLAHTSKARIQLLRKWRKDKGLTVKGVKSHGKECACTTCLQVNNAKRAKNKERVHEPEITAAGQLVTSDLTGPFPPTPEGHRYAISFTDEHTRFSVCYFLSRKNGAAAALRAYHKYCKFYGITVKSIRTDRGGEFGGHLLRMSLEGGVADPSDAPTSFADQGFINTCRSLKIRHQSMPAYRPELHGIAERWNRTVMTMANSMLQHAHISPVLWSSAVAHANLIRNRLPTRARDDCTPYELFHGRLPRYDNLRVWGSYCYKLLPDRKKIPGLPVRKRLIYVGETDDMVGFRCFDPTEFKFTTEYELIFDEESVNRRHALLHDYDDRRKKYAEGRGQEVPLVFDNSEDFVKSSSTRNVFLPEAIRYVSNHSDAASVELNLSPNGKSVQFSKAPPTVVPASDTKSAIGSIPPSTTGHAGQLLEPSGSARPVEVLKSCLRPLPTCKNQSFDSSTSASSVASQSVSPVPSIDNGNVDGTTRSLSHGSSTFKDSEDVTVDPEVIAPRRSQRTTCCESKFQVCHLRSARSHCAGKYR